MGDTTGDWKEGMTKYLKKSKVIAWMKFTRAGSNYLVASMEWIYPRPEFLPPAPSVVTVLLPQLEHTAVWRGEHELLGQPVDIR